MYISTFLRKAFRLRDSPPRLPFAKSVAKLLIIFHIHKREAATRVVTTSLIHNFDKTSSWIHTLSLLSGFAPGERIRMLRSNYCVGNLPGLGFVYITRQHTLWFTIYIHVT